MLRKPKSYTLFIFLLIFSPLAFGTVEQWSLTIMEGCSLWALFLLCGERREDLQPFYRVPGIVPLLVLWAYCLLQLVPFPSGLVHIISPATYKAYSETIGSIEPVTWMTLSVSKKATLQEWSRLTAYIAFYIVTVQLLSSKELLRKTVNTVMIFSFCLAFLSILQYFFYNGKIYWIRSLTQGGHPFGPYANKNHYAGLMEMLFPVILSVLISFKPRVKYRSLRERLAQILSLKETNRYILIGFFSVLVASSIFLSLSRGGMVSLGLSMIFFSGMIAWKKKRNKRGLFIIVFFLMIFLVVSLFGWDPIVESFGKIKDVDVHGKTTLLRPTLWSDSKLLIQDFPLTGTGYGTFFNSYQKYRTFPGGFTAYHAENDYIEVLAEGGIIGFLLAGWFMCAVFYHSYRTLLRRKESYNLYLSIGSATGLVAILLHSIVDFNLHLGANGLYFFFLSGLMVSATHTRMRDKLDASYLALVNNPPLVKWSRAVVVLLLATTTVNVGATIAELSFSGVKEQNTGKQLLMMKDKVCLSALCDPLDARYQYALGRIEMTASNADKALRCFKRALENDPLNSWYLQTIGIVYSGRSDFARAELLLRRGIEYDKMNTLGYKMYALWLVGQGRKGDGLKNIALAMALEPEQTYYYVALMVLNGYRNEEILEALPQKMVPYVIFGSYLEKTGDETTAERVYLDALGFVGNERDVPSSYFYTVSDFFKRKKDYDAALRVIQKGLTLFPGDPAMLLNSAMLYEQLGMTYRAMEEYRKVLLIDPTIKYARDRLNALTP